MNKDRLYCNLSHISDCEWELSDGKYFKFSLYYFSHDEWIKAIKDNTAYDLIISKDHKQIISNDELSKIIDTISVAFPYYYDYVHSMMKMGNKVLLKCKLSIENVLSYPKLNVEYIPINKIQINHDKFMQFVESTKFKDIQHTIRMTGRSFDGLILCNDIKNQMYVDGNENSIIIYNKEIHDEISNLIDHLLLFKDIQENNPNDEFIDWYLKYLKSIDTSNVKRVN